MYNCVEYQQRVASGRLLNRTRKAYSTPGYWFCTDMEKREDRGPLPPAGSPPPPLPPRDSKGFQVTDPRRFNFAIVCMSCGHMEATLQEARTHLQNCPAGLSVDVLCGHCEKRTSSWATMCAHLNAPGMQKEAPCKPEYRMRRPPRPEFRQATSNIQLPAASLTSAATGQPIGRGSLLAWRSPPALSRSPSGEEARQRRHAELSSTLAAWNRRHPKRAEMRKIGERVPRIPLEPVLDPGSSSPNAAAEREKVPPPTSPEPEEAYSPPLDAGEWWTSEDQRAVEELLNTEPLMSRLSPLVTPPLWSEPTAVGLGMPPLARPGGPTGVVVPTRGPIPTLGHKETERLETPPPTLIGHPRGRGALQTSEMLEEAATVACILKEPDLADILQVPDLSLLSPPVPTPKAEPEPVDVVIIPDSPPRASTPPSATPIDYQRAYEDLCLRVRGYITQMRFWAETVGTIGAECPRSPTLQEQARRRQLITAGLWPEWMENIVNVPFAELGNQFQVYYGALLHEGGPRF